MQRNLGDLRGNPAANGALVAESLSTLGYVVTSDSAPIGLDPAFRTTVLPGFANRLVEDKFGLPPAGRLRVSGLVDYVFHSGEVELVRDYSDVVVPSWAGNGFAKPRVYPNGLPLASSDISNNWFRNVITLAKPVLIGAEGSVCVHYVEQGRGDTAGRDIGKVVKRPHQDGEYFVGTFLEKINGGDAKTTLFKAAPNLQDVSTAEIDTVSSYTLAVGDIALSSDIEFYHYVSDISPPSDGSPASRRALILVFNRSRTHRWLQEYYASGAVSAEIAA